MTTENGTAKTKAKEYDNIIIRPFPQWEGARIKSSKFFPEILVRLDILVPIPSNEQEINDVYNKKNAAWLLNNEPTTGVGFFMAMAAKQNCYNERAIMPYGEERFVKGDFDPREESEIALLIPEIEGALQYDPEKGKRKSADVTTKAKAREAESFEKETGLTMKQATSIMTLVKDGMSYDQAYAKVVSGE